MQTDSGETTRIPLLPFTLGGRRLGARMPLPKVGEHTVDLMRELGYPEELIASQTKGKAA